MDLVDLIESRRFLGGEFMLWLWYRGECFEGRWELPELGTVELWFDDALSMEAYLAETERNDLKGGAPTASPEAKTALRQGKRPTKAKLLMIREGREWNFTLKAPSLDLTGVSIPSLLSREEEEQFYERMALVEELEELVEALYRQFLAVRLHPAWHDAVLPAMQDWIERDEPVDPSHFPTDDVDAALAAQPAAPARAPQVLEDDEAEDAADEAAVAVAAEDVELTIVEPAAAEGKEEPGAGADATTTTTMDAAPF